MPKITDPSIDDVFADPAISFWLKGSLNSALARDPVDAARDAALLSRLLDQHAAAVLSANSAQLGLPKNAP